jgi:hypothetical protein
VLSASTKCGDESDHFFLKEKLMSKLFSIGVFAAAIGLEAVHTANAGDRYYGCYSWYYYPSAPVVTAPAAPVSVKAVPSVGQTAQSDNRTYRSFSAEPPVTTGQSGAVYGGTYFGSASGYGGAYADPGNLNASQDDPTGMNPTVIGGRPGWGSNYGTAGNPYGGDSTPTIGRFFSSGNTLGGTAGRPY